MANPEHLENLKQGVEHWNKWRKVYRDVEPDLSGAYLRRAELKDVNLSRANLSKANLSWAHSASADLTRTNLRGANLYRANLVNANLTEADLESANLIAANLTEGSLSGANMQNSDLRWAVLGLGEALRGADLSHASVGPSIFTDADLSGIRGLDTIHHSGPSTIGFDTIYRSGGKIPETFLRGCGVPDEFIDFIRQMGVRPVEFYSCFISYSTKDQEFAERLHADLQAKGVRCWFAPEEMKAGRKLHEQIDEAIRLHDKLLLILSEHSMTSNWVKTEIANAREREKQEGKQLLFPITLVPFEAIRQWKLFDADIGIDSARQIREYFIPDFSNWKDHDSYQAAFQRLVKDLKAGASG